MSDLDDALPNDDFSTSGNGAQPASVSKPKTFMGFTPPPDEIEGTHLRRRKARAGRKGLLVQGGEG